MDQFFSQIAQSFNKSDVFSTAELGKVAEPYASVIIDQGDIVMEWHNCLTKYTTMPGVRSHHDFVFARRPSTRNTEVRVREHCHEGNLMASSMKVAASHLADEITIPTVSYKSRGLIELSSTKYAHLVKDV